MALSIHHGRGRRVCPGRYLQLGRSDHRHQRRPGRISGYSVIVEHALLPVRAEMSDKFRSAFSEAKAIISGMPGFQSLTLSRCIERPDVFLLLVGWDRLEDHTIGFPAVNS
jgi:Antibiotic biosynthesis monooxygenase